MRNLTHHRLDNGLKSIPVDNRGAGLVVFLLADPHLLDGREGGEDGTTDPHGSMCAQVEQ